MDNLQNQLSTSILGIKQLATIDVLIRRVLKSWILLLFKTR